jgi:hypothetical protein
VVLGAPLEVFPDPAFLQGFLHDRDAIGTAAPGITVFESLARFVHSNFRVSDGSLSERLNSSHAAVIDSTRNRNICMTEKQHRFLDRLALARRLGADIVIAEAGIPELRPTTLPTLPDSSEAV